MCENENCSDKGKIEFYCKICLKNICRKCKNQNEKNHDLISYEEFFKDENIVKFKSNVKETSNFIKENNSEYAKFIEDIENISKNIKEIFKKKKKEIKIY